MSEQSIKGRYRVVPSIRGGWTYQWAAYNEKKQTFSDTMEGVRHFDTEEEAEADAQERFAAMAEECARELAVRNTGWKAIEVPLPA